MTLFDNIIRIVSGIWEAFVMPYKPLWIIFLALFGLALLFSKTSKTS